MSKKTAVVLFGSVSSEYEVSLRSAASVLRNFPREDYNVIMLGITRDGRWYEYNGQIDDIENNTWEQNGPITPAIISPDRGHGGLLRITPSGIQTEQIDVIFPVLHGENSEDGTMQGLLKISGVPFVGCGVTASAICMDKEITHIMLGAAGIETAPYVALVRADLSRMDDVEPTLVKKLGYPMFVKPANTGSSVGVSKVKSKSELRAALELAFKYDRKIVVETAIIGTEAECAAIGNYSDCEISVVGEIVPRHEFYDYSGKYLDDSTDLYIPARLPQNISDKIRETASKAYAVMGCTGLSRIDFFARADGSVVLNELNTIPGFTSISMYAKLFDACGVTYKQLISRLLALALEG